MARRDEDDEEPKVEIHGVVAQLYAQRDDWCAGKLHETGGGMVRFSGHAVVQAGAQVKLVGQWDSHPEYGPFFDVSHAETQLPTDATGIVTLLMSDKRFHGIGPVRARAIVDVVLKEKLDLSTVLATADGRAWLAKTASTPTKVVETLAEVWERGKATNEAKIGLFSMGVTPGVVDELASRFGGCVNAHERVKRNPYVLFQEVDGFGFKKADAIAMRQGFKKTDKRRLTASLILGIDEALADGHTWSSREEVLNNAARLLELPRSKEYLVEEALEEVISSPGSDAGVVTVDVGKELAISRREMVIAERALLEGLKPETKKAPLKHSSEEELVKLEPRLNEAQRNAVLTCMKTTRAVITGPAGTGKTFVVATLVRAFEASFQIPLVLAPTGRAAKRLEETFRKQGLPYRASTVHRALGFKGGNQFEHSRKFPLDANLVIVDEASMLDTKLAHRVVDALKPDTTLVLVGDHNQIPPVGAGAVLRDLVKTELCPVARLKDVVRQAGVLRRNSLAVLKGKLKPTVDWDEKLKLVPWIVSSRFDDAEEVLEVVTKRFMKKLERHGPAALTKVQVISPQRNGLIGIDSLNAKLQRIVQKKLYGVDIGEDEPVKIRVGDKVMQTRNNYDVDVMNGDQALVVAQTSDGLLLDVFSGSDRRRVLIPADKSGSIVLSYACTVHKAQGGEFDFVMGVCHRSHTYMWHRNLFYTMVTRAARSVSVFGDERGMENAIRKVDAQERRTLLGHWAAGFKRKKKRVVKKLRKLGGRMP